MDIIIILILIFIIWPIIKAAWHIYRLQNKARQMFSQAANAQQSAPRDTQQRKAGWSSPVNRKKKKISRDVGEYVAYETIITSETTSTDSKKSENQTYGSSSESRISDADWEEI